MTATRDEGPRRGNGRGGATRRQFLLGGAVLGAGAAVAIGADQILRDDAGAPTVAGGPALHGEDTVPFHGPHQAGIATPAQAHATFVGLDLRDGVDRPALQRLMRVLSDDSARLTQGEPPLTDLEPELARVPARLTVTFGFGPGLLAAAGVDGPEWLRPLPPFGIDRLREEFSGGDLVLQVAAEDPVTVAHAVRALLKGARGSTTVRWVQQGFRRSHGSVRPGTTMRNLFGQVDGTTNPAPGTADFDRLVWIADGPAAGGTGMVLRRIHMDLEGWDELGRVARENTVGRTLADGAPLTGGDEFTEADLEAATPQGFPLIPAESHMRR
ncbi:MAG: Dyp-type peroxidase, partial [Actinomycetaceae bacterium]